jgi:phosphoenolpyruvate carboxylase
VTTLRHIARAVAPAGDHDGQAHYIDQLIELLWGEFMAVVSGRVPKLRRMLEGSLSLSALDSDDRVAFLQATGIWFQLLTIAEENAAMRSRRRLEQDGGPDAVVGSFCNVIGEIAAAGVSPRDIGLMLTSADVRSTLTAHPTEAKRVTVLELHRRIYRKLIELEHARWTPRERDRLIAEVRAEIDVLWMTGELRLERPTVDNEIAWGLHFFREVLFDVMPQVLERLEYALMRHYPESPVDVPGFFRFSSWIGGDRDGNPGVTAAITARAIEEGRRAAIERFRQRLSFMVRTPSSLRRPKNSPSGSRSSSARAVPPRRSASAMPARCSGNILPAWRCGWRHRSSWRSVPMAPSPISRARNSSATSRSPRRR